MKAIDLLATGARSLLSLLYPPCCEACGTPIEAPLYLCVQCASGVVRIRPPFCQICSEPFAGKMSGSFTCGNCAGRHFHFRCAVAAFRSDGVVRELIHRFKYSEKSSEYRLRHQLGAWAAEGLRDERMREEPIDALVPVPLHSARERRREFNQAAELARIIGREAHIPVLDCLLRIRNTPSQVMHDRKGRMENLRNAFAMRQSMNVRGRRLVLIDDVFTTGSTLDECALVLLKAGAASIRGLTAARG